MDESQIYEILDELERRIRDVEHCAFANADGMAEGRGFELAREIVIDIIDEMRGEL